MQSIKLEKFNTDIKIGFLVMMIQLNVFGCVWALFTVSNLSNRLNLYADPLVNKKTIDF